MRSRYVELTVRMQGRFILSGICLVSVLSTLVVSIINITHHLGPRVKSQSALTNRVPFLSTDTTHVITFEFIRNSFKSFLTVIDGVNVGLTYLTVNFSW